MDAIEIEAVRALAIRVLGLTGTAEDVTTNRICTTQLHARDWSQTLTETELWRAAKIEVARRSVMREHMPPTSDIDASWRILAELFVTGTTGREMSVSSACLASGAPTTTALKHIKMLVQQGLVLRCYDPGDRRRANLVLSREGRVKVKLILAAQMRAESRAYAEFRSTWNKVNSLAKAMK